MKRTPIPTWVLCALGLVLSLALAGPTIPVAQAATPDRNPRATGVSDANRVARPAGSVKVRKKNVDAGATQRVRGRVAHGPRKVKIQVRSAGGGRWRKVASKKSKRSGKFAIAFRAPSRAGRFEVRAVAPRAKVKGKRRSAVKTRAVRFNVRPSTGPIPVLPAEKEVLTLVNQERAKAGCGPVAYEWHLHVAARGFSVEMAHHNTHATSHNSTDGRTPSDRITAAGYHWSAWGENIAYKQDTAAEVMDAWMNSAPHKANIQNCMFTELGVGLAKDSNGYNYWTQDFGDR